MTRGCVFIPVTAEDMGFTMDSGICRRRHRNRRGNRNMSKNNLRYRTSDGLWASLFSPEDSDSGSSEKEEMELVIDGDQNQCRKQLGADLGVLEDSEEDSDESDVEVEFVDNRRRRRNKRRQQRRRRMREVKQKAEEEGDIVLTLDSSAESEDEDSEIQEDNIVDFSSNVQSLKEADPVINEDKYEFSLQLADVTPENITVSIKDQVLTISAKKEEVSDDGSTTLLQELTKKIILPENVLEKELKSSLSANGVLKIEAPLAKPQSEASVGKDIPIQIEIEGSTN